ncbi:TauD/TfdA family dioxygenase [Candidatus Neptunochlamydia vexilliferae]|uniref:TauD/TfdA-like domain-containing protein n=1 Tax=Candidatus Neptunichlamydia vexilliferae TaxID=1651774 RepID=A0ABS0AXY4_9BACT|nr:TauD/TfdA family dioxygenase [Candidatus Neptunochlamydia vexilliferae]MBF5058992.1 hypothetical protein [Candidatus Neptunochlamydia vexilliferae]
MEKVKIEKSDKHFLIEVSPKENCSPDFLRDWALDHRPFLEEQIGKYGGVLFKGFSIKKGSDFEKVALAIDENLTDKHVFDGAVGTKRTRFVSDVASPDLKDVPMPLSMHNEDSFVSKVPPKIMFCSLTSAPWGGESLVADCRKVYQSLPQEVQKKYRLQKLKSMLVLEDKLFLANSLIPKNIELIEAFAKGEGAHTVKRISYDMTRFLFTVPATLTLNGEEDVWFNTLHQSVFYNKCVDIWMAYKMLGGIKNRLRSLSLIGSSLSKDFITFLKKGSDPLKMHDCHLENGEKITAWDRFQMGLAFWKNTAVLPLKDGEFFVLDNRLVSHGRMPYRGRRVMVSAMTKPQPIA